MRFVRVVLALVFGLAMAGPETHACPVHSATPAGHHQDATGHQTSDTPSGAHCTCPQTCCPPAAGVSLPVSAANWTDAAAPLVSFDLETLVAVNLPTRTHFLPFALAPPPRA